MRELLIVSPYVVEDARALPGGPWHFGSLIRQMLPPNATKSEQSDFVKAWFRHWTSISELNGFPVTPRRGVDGVILCPWINASNQVSNCQGDLDLDLAPFRLLAIANRMDLRDPQDPESAGEGRFVFGLVDQPSRNPIRNGYPLSMTVIFEYTLPVTSHTSPKQWADAWHALGSSRTPCQSASGCESYRSALQRITDSFSMRGVSSSEPNGNALSQIRTNDISTGSAWELREFGLTSQGLVQRPTAQTPDLSLNNSPALVDFVRTHAAEILDERHEVPLHMLAGAAPSGVGKWQINGFSEELRFQFAKNTCNGCHSDEPQRIPSSGGFFHISPFGAAGTYRVSWWLMNKDLPLRMASLKAALDESCLGEFRSYRSSRVH
jgi:hypothetical protein